MKFSCRGHATMAKNCTKKRDVLVKMFVCQSKPSVFFAACGRHCKNSLMLSSRNFATMVT